MSEAYVTILINDSYLPGSLVLGRSLRLFGTTKKLVILISNLSNKSIELLSEVYDEIIPVRPIMSNSLEELNTLGRIDLISTYTKILIWKLNQFKKIVYLDSDTLPIKPIDFFFDIELKEGQIAASPDSGWPDIFNSGVFITIPNQKDFNGLSKLINEGENPSFDGADQGLLNEYFKSSGNWARLPFGYNVTPSAGYQYVPAYNRYFEDIKILHFIGLNKPWLSRDSSFFANGSFGKGYEILVSLHSNWWKVFNRFYFGSIAGEIFELSNSRNINYDNDSNIGEGWALNLPKLKNKWDELNLEDSDNKEEEVEEEDDNSINIPKIFPWENNGNREEPTRVFDESTDFHVQSLLRD